MHRDSDRKMSALKQELETLHRSYASLEADYQEGEESYNELRMQMELKERTFVWNIMSLEIVLRQARWL